MNFLDSFFNPANDNTLQIHAFYAFALRSGSCIFFMCYIYHLPLIFFLTKEVKVEHRFPVTFYEQCRC